MSFLDLGEIAEPVLFFGGPCSNLHSTEALFDLADREGYTADRIICTGDLVAYCGDPAATVQLIRNRGIHVVLGNCEESLGNSSEDCGCGFDEATSCDLLAQQWYRFAQQHIDADARSWLRNRPAQIRLRMAGRQIAVTHGSISTINEFIFPATDAGVKQQQLELADADAVVGGHCGVPFSQLLGTKLWHNPGIVGIPANDGSQRVWFSSFEPQAEGIKVSHRSLEYDVGGAVARMVGAALPPDYARTLETGMWPAHDIMPATDQQRAGIRIENREFLWT